MVLLKKEGLVQSQALRKKNFASNVHQGFTKKVSEKNS